jgi:F0F1-type ATP synthase membrane subunit a
MILLELLAYVTRTLSLGLRLAVNMITGHILAKVVVGFIWAMAAGNSWLLFIIATDYEGENSIKRKRISY